MSSRPVTPRLLAVVIVAAWGGCQAPEGGDSSVVAPEPEPAAVAPAPVLAARLSRLVWDAEPDPELIRSLDAGTITRERVARLSERMLADPRARAGVAAFFGWWLQLGGVPRKEDAGVIDDDLARSMIAEAPALGTYLTLDTPGRFADLLTAPFTFVDERLALHYGIAGVAGPEMRKAAYPAGEPRMGVFTGAGVLAVFASLSNPSWPAKRGWLVTDPGLCTVVIRSFLPTESPDPRRSLREQMIEVTKNGTCMSCHALLNSPGFAFIGFDSYGRWRPGPVAGPAETSGWIPEAIMPDQPTFQGVDGLVGLLLSRPEASRCFARQWLRFGTDRRTMVSGEISESERRSLETVYRSFASASFELRALIPAIARADLFLAP